MKRFIALVLLCFWIGSSVVLAIPSPSQVPSPTVDVQEARSLTAVRDQQGHVWAVWEGDSGRDVDLYFSRWVDSEWSAVQPVHSRPDAWDRSPSLAIAADGVIWLAWASASKRAPGQSKLYVSRWEDQRWTPPDTVPLGQISNVAEPVLAAGPDGKVWLAWVGFEGTIDGIFASYWDGRQWSDARQVSAADNDPSLYDRQPRLAVGASGRPWVVWTGHQSGIDDEIYGSYWTGTVWAAEQIVSQDDDTLDVWPTLALDAQGRPWVAWKAQVRDGEETRLRILLSRWDASRHTWTSEALVSSPVSVRVEESYPSLAADGQMAMNLVWLADGATDSALAHARWEKGQWSEPSMVQSGVHTYDVIPLIEEQESPLLLWLVSRPGSESPLSQARVDDFSVSLENWSNEQPRFTQPQGTPPISNKYLAFGDSITWGQYPSDDPEHPPFYPYPAILEDMLTVRVTTESNVVNAGKPGEGTHGGKTRIKEEVVDHRPHYVLIMEGTNDVSRKVPPAEACANLIWMIGEARKSAGVDDVEVMLATIIPRLDDKNDETEEYNQEAVICAQQSLNHVRLCDPWQAFYDYGPWQDLYCWWEGYCDDKHPNQEGLQLLADTFYTCILEGFNISEESIPPATWIQSLPEQTECGQGTVAWAGGDNLSWVVDYDVQKNVNGGDWTDWLVATQATSATYTGDHYGDVLGFRVRGRDVVGNQSDWSTPAYTTITDSDPPQAAMNPLPPVQIPPFPLNWTGSDACSDVVAYQPQYRIGAAGTWENVLPAPHTTAGTSVGFDPGAPDYGQTYYFRVQAQDQGGNWSPWSNEVQTEVAQFTLQGHAYNVRHQPIVAPQVSLDPPSMTTTPRPGGGFTAYLAATGDYDVAVARDDLYGPLPAMQDLAVGGDVTGLEFFLPPQDDAVTDGGFEAGSLAAWQVGGSTLPSLTTEAHTGLGAVRLGGAGETLRLSQTLTSGPAIVSPTLSFVTRLESAGPAGAVAVELSNGRVFSPPVTFTLEVDDVAWRHAWFDLDGVLPVSTPLTLTLTTSDSAALLLDEISLGSSIVGGYWTYVPLAARGW